MNVEAAQFLRLCEVAGTICHFDIEGTGLKGDYNSVLVVTLRPYRQAPITFSVRRPGNDEMVVKEAKRALEQMDCWVSYYGKGYDIKMLNTRLLRWGVPGIEKRHHLDMYYMLKSNLLTARRSQAHLLDWSDQPEVHAFLQNHEVDEGTHAKKMSVSAEIWNKLLAEPRKYMPTMIERCESDTLGLTALYDRTKHLAREITR